MAIKILPDPFAGDRKRLARFNREAKALAALNHPNIAVIYGIEQSDDTHALVMELIEGETLATIIKGEPEWALLPENTPPTIHLLLRKCLNKDRKRRLQYIADARVDLEPALGDPIPDSGWFPFDPVASAAAATNPNATLGPIAQFDGLTPGTTYGFRLKARDLSEQRNETVWFGPSYFTTLDTDDVTPPVPNPSEWDPTLDPNDMDGSPRLVVVDPNFAERGWGVTMTATVAVDAASPPVEYFFECLNAPEFSSGWIIDPTYRVLVGFRAKAAELIWTVRARDCAGNVTESSVAAKALLPL